MKLVWFEVFVFRSGVIEDLDFDAFVGRVTCSWVMDGDAIVAARRELEFEAEDVVGVGLLSDEVFTFRGANDGAVFDLVAFTDPS